MKTISQHINESKNNYKVYHETYSGAIQTALDWVKTRGYEYDEEETATKIGLQSSRPKNGDTEKVTITLYKNNKEQKKALQIQVTDLGKNYELNAYIN